MGPLGVVEAEVGVEPGLGLPSAGVGLKYTSSYFTVRHSLSTKMLSMYRPFPSVLILTPWLTRRAVKPSLVNWLPWSVLKTSGFPLLRASSKASTQKLAPGCWTGSKPPRTGYANP